MITQAFSLTRVRTLERKLEAKMIKEESDYHDLESAVQQVEQNLELMTVSSQGPCLQWRGRRACLARRREASGAATWGAQAGAMSRGPSYGLPSRWAGPPGDGEGREQGDVLCPSCRVSDGFFFFLVGESETCSEGRKSRPETETGGQLAPGN